MKGAVDGEQAERTAGALALIHGSGVERHGNGSGFVGGGIVKFAVEQDYNRHERCLAGGGDTQNSQGPRPRLFLLRNLAFPGSDLGTLFLAGDRGRKRHRAGQRQQGSAV